MARRDGPDANRNAELDWIPSQAVQDPTRLPEIRDLTPDEKCGSPASANLWRRRVEEANSLHIIKLSWQRIPAPRHRNLRSPKGGVANEAAKMELLHHARPVGARAGTAVAALTGKKNVVLPAETLLSFRLRRPITVSVRS